MKRLVMVVLSLFVFIGYSYAQFTSFDASTPVVVAAKEEKVYNKYWLQKFIVEAPKPSEPAVMKAVFVAYDGAGEIDPNATPIYVELPDLFGTATTDSDIATAMEMTFRALKKLGVQQGVFVQEVTE